MSEWKPHEVFAAVKSMVASDPDNIRVIVEAVTAGARENVERMNELRMWADQSLLAATMLLTNKVQTPALKAHLEFCITRYYQSQGGGSGASIKWMDRFPLPSQAERTEGD